MRLRPQDIIVKDRFRKDLGSLDSLKRSLQRPNGQLQPILVWEDEDGRHHLLDGGRRLASVVELGLEDIEARVVDLDDPLRAQFDANVEHKSFTPTEMVAIAAAMEEQERERAKARQHAGRRHEAIPAEEKGRVRDRIAKGLGVSGRTLEKAKAVVEAGKKNPALAPVVEEMATTGRVDRAHQKVVAHRKASRLKAPAARPDRTAMKSDEFLQLVHDVASRVDGVRDELAATWRRMNAAQADRAAYLALLSADSEDGKLARTNLAQGCDKLTNAAKNVLKQSDVLRSDLTALKAAPEPVYADDTLSTADLDEVPPPIPAAPELHAD